MDVGVMGSLDAGVSEQPRSFFQRHLLAANPEGGSRMAEHVWSKANPRLFAKSLHKGHDRLVGHGTPNIAFPQIHKDKIGKGIDFQRSQILDEVICVKLHDLGQHRDDIGISGLRPRTIWIVSARNNLERTIFDREVCMFETKHLANPHTRLEKECEQKLVSDMRAGINECLYLFDGQCFGKSPLSLGRNDSPLLWFRFHNTMQKWLVSPPVWHGQLIQGKLRNGTQAHVKLVQAVAGTENLINGGIGSRSFL